MLSAKCRSYGRRLGDNAFCEVQTIRSVLRRKRELLFYFRSVVTSIVSNGEQYWKVGRTCLFCQFSATGVLCYDADAVEPVGKCGNEAGYFRRTVSREQFARGDGRSVFRDEEKPQIFD